MGLAILSGKPYFSISQHVGGPIVEEETRKRFHEFADQAFARNFLTNSGPLAERLEREVAELHGVSDAVLVANGFLAQLVLMQCMELGEGEAIVPANTFVATAHACETYGLNVVFCEMDAKTLNIDAEAAERLITDRTRLIVPTHVFGVFSDMPRLREICDKHGIALLADAAHAFDCDLGGVRAGGFGASEFLSFHATKYFSSIEGGAIVTNDSELAKRARSVRNFGFSAPNNAELLGINAKMSEMSAAYGLASLPALDGRREKLLTVRNAYLKVLTGVPGLRIHQVDAWGRNNYRYFAIFIEDDFPLTRDEAEWVLRAENILPRSYFSPGCHGMGYYRKRGNWELPITDEALGRILCLPTSFVGVDWEESAYGVANMFCEMAEKVDEIREAFDAENEFMDSILA